MLFDDRLCETRITRTGGIAAWSSPVEDAGRSAQRRPPEDAARGEVGPQSHRKAPGSIACFPAPTAFSPGLGRSASSRRSGLPSPLRATADFDSGVSTRDDRFEQFARASWASAKSKWLLPLFAVALGFVLLAAQWIGGDPGSGLASLGIVTAFGSLVLFGGRSETIRGLRGDGRDERFRQIDIYATAIAGLALIAAIIVAFVVELARGHSGSPYAWLGAIGGLAYLLAIIVFRLRG